jgi:hypothetical protein
MESPTKKMVLFTKKSSARVRIVCARRSARQRRAAGAAAAAPRRTGMSAVVFKYGSHVGKSSSFFMLRARARAARQRGAARRGAGCERRATHNAQFSSDK